MLIYDDKNLWRDLRIIDGDFFSYLFAFDQSGNIEEVFTIKGSMTG